MTFWKSLIALCIAAPLAQAGSFWWAGLGNWNNPDSWVLSFNTEDRSIHGVPGTAPGDTAYFRGGASPIDLGSGAVVNSIIGRGAYWHWLQYGIFDEAESQIFGTGPIGSQNLTILNTIESDSDFFMDIGFTFNCTVTLGNSGEAADYSLTFAGNSNPFMVFNAHVSGGSGGSKGEKNLIVTHRPASPRAFVTFNAGISDGGAEKLNLIIQEDTVTISAPTTYSGDTRLAGGKISLNVQNAISRLSNFFADNGVIDAKEDQHLGSLNVARSSTGYTGLELIFSGTQTDIAFANSSMNIWTGVVLLTSFQIGSDTLRFGTDSSGLTPAQLAAISLPGYKAGLDDNGYVTFTAIPEPASLVLALGGIGGLLLFRRRS